MTPAGKRWRYRASKPEQPPGVAFQDRVLLLRVEKVLHRNAEAYFGAAS